jgi:hypothetical protein
MTRHRFVIYTLSSSLLLAPIVGCEQLPGGPKEQGTAIGGLSGAAAGAALDKDNRLIGALIGGALGAGGGYLVGANWDKISGKDKDKAKEDATKASRRAEENPATAKDVDRSKTADLNDDGFVTLDEVVAQSDAGLSSKEQIRRLQATQQYFELSDQQEQYLKDHGVSSQVVTAMRDMNRDTRTASYRQTSDDSIGSQRIGRQ